MYLYNYERIVPNPWCNLQKDLPSTYQASHNPARPAVVKLGKNAPAFTWRDKSGVLDLVGYAVAVLPPPHVVRQAWRRREAEFSDELGATGTEKCLGQSASPSNLDMRFGGEVINSDKMQVYACGYHQG
uniref:Uncharacterized protein n=1 Tax=Oryza punctata TaxID=4537 RepID=A0A0E0MM72_ORYPU